MPLPEALADRRTLVQEVLARLAATAPTEDGRPGNPAGRTPDDELIATYMLAVFDVLRILGVVEPETDTHDLCVSSVQASYFLRLVGALLQLNEPLVGNWAHRGVSARTSHVFHTGVDFLHALEQRRLELEPDSEPLRSVKAAVGLIARRGPGGQIALLLIWDAAAGSWQFIGGQYDAGDTSLRATMMRELAEELACPPLQENVDVVLAELGPPFAEQRISPTLGLLTRTLFQVYVVRFITPRPELPPDVRWIDEAEIVAGTTGDGEPIAAAPYMRVRELAHWAFVSLVADEMND
jgi:8-oxo-dGTP pyrophosphatase MutT (NUDIX family)